MVITRKQIRAIARSEFDRFKEQIKSAAKGKRKPKRLYTFSHMVMGGVMMMFLTATDPGSINTDDGGGAVG